MKDCGIKNVSAPNDYSYDTIKTLMMNPNGKNIMKDVLKFLEEAQNELVCIMSSNWDSWDTMGFCVTYREKHGLTGNETDTCWEKYYSTLPDHFDFDFDKSIDVSTCRK